MYRRANHPNTTEGTSAVGVYANQGCVPKIRAHNLEDISRSTLMAIGESVSSDYCLKDEYLQCLSVHLKSGNISFFFSDFEVLLLNDTLHDIPHQSAQNKTWHGDSWRNPEPHSCDSIKVTLLKEKKNPSSSPVQ